MTFQMPFAVTLIHLQNKPPYIRFQEPALARAASIPKNQFDVVCKRSAVKSSYSVNHTLGAAVYRPVHLIRIDHIKLPLRQGGNS